MQIEKLVVKNFACFENREFAFHPRFNLLVGDNATGKSSILNALAVSAGSWFLGLRGYAKSPGIDPGQVRVVPHEHADSFTFEKQFPARIECRGLVMGQRASWVRELKHENGKTTSVESKELVDAARHAEESIRAGKDITVPLICTYGTERLWFEKRRRSRKEGAEPTNGMPSRLDGYRECIDFTIQETALIDWVRDQTTVSAQFGRDPIALSVVKDAIVSCVEGAKSIYYDGRYKDLVVLMDMHGQQLRENLSDGQRIMLALVGDLARRAATLNPHLADKALRETPGIVMVDELDLHLHPKWQRRVIQDLKTTFPRFQFIATTHSPQLIGEALPEEIRVLDDDKTTTPQRSFGIDSSRVLEEVMGARPRNAEVGDLLQRISRFIDREEFSAAESLLAEVQAKLGADDPEVTRARTLMTFLQSTE